MTDNGDKQTIQPKSREVEILEKRLLELAAGEAVPYGDLTKLIGMDVRPTAGGRGYQRLHSARHSLKDRVFCAGDGGVRRLTDKEILDLQATRTKHIHKTAAKSKCEVLAVDVTKLDADTRNQFNLRLSHALMLAAATTTLSVKRLALSIASANDSLPPNKTGLALFLEEPDATGPDAT